MRRSITTKRATFSLDRHAWRTNGSLWLARALATVDDGAPGIDVSSYSNGWIGFLDCGLRSATQDRHDELAKLRPEPQRNGVREGGARPAPAADPGVSIGASGTV